MEQELGHLPVMLTEVILALSPHPGSFQIDATVGGGGHASRILEAANPDGRLLGIDADPRAIERSAHRLASYGERVTLRRSNFEDIASVAAETGFDRVDGILMDLGVSSQQLDDDDRGFSFRSTERLDMRFDTSPRHPRQRGRRHLRRGGPGRPLPPPRRGAPRAAHRPCHRRGALPADHRDARGAGRDHRRCDPAHAGPPSPASRDARLPGPAHRGQPRAGDAAGRAGGLPGPAQAGRPPLRHQLPLPRGPHRQALPGA